MADLEDLSGAERAAIFLLGVGEETAPVRRARNVASFETRMHVFALGFKRASVGDRRGLIRHPCAELGGTGPRGKVGLHVRPPERFNTHDEANRAVRVRPPERQACALVCMQVLGLVRGQVREESNRGPVDALAQDHARAGAAVWPKGGQTHGRRIAQPGHLRVVDPRLEHRQRSVEVHRVRVEFTVVLLTKVLHAERFNRQALNPCSSNAEEQAFKYAP